MILSLYGDPITVWRSYHCMVILSLYGDVGMLPQDPHRNVGRNRSSIPFSRARSNHLPTIGMPSPRSPITIFYSISRSPITIFYSISRSPITIFYPFSLTLSYHHIILSLSHVLLSPYFISLTFSYHHILSLSLTRVVQSGPGRNTPGPARAGWCTSGAWSASQRFGFCVRNDEVRIEPETLRVMGKSRRTAGPGRGP